MPEKESFGSSCEPGYYCPKGASDHIGCPPGKYNTKPKQIKSDGVCLTCKEGFYCPRATVNYVNHPCKKGHYCPTSSESPIACPEGKYNNYTKGISELDCKPCDKGMYCRGKGNVEPDGKCEAGYFCSGGAITSKPEKKERGGGREMQTRSILWAWVCGTRWVSKWVVLRRQDHRSENGEVLCGFLLHGILVHADA
jgi:hypothetical protein